MNKLIFSLLNSTVASASDSTKLTIVSNGLKISRKGDGEIEIKTTSKDSKNGLADLAIGELLKSIGLKGSVKFLDNFLISLRRAMIKSSTKKMVGMPSNIVEKMFRLMVSEGFLDDAQIDTIIKNNGMSEKNKLNILLKKLKSNKKKQTKIKNDKKKNKELDENKKGNFKFSFTKKMKKKISKSSK